MAGIATKAADNVLYNARIKAQAGNDRLGSRENAAEIMGIDRTRLARMELGMLTPYPEEILLMAETYNAPELMNHFCTCECPIGKRMIPRAELIQLDRLTIKILNAVDGVQDVGATMRRIAPGVGGSYGNADLDAKVCARWRHGVGGETVNRIDPETIIAIGIFIVVPICCALVKIFGK